MVAIVANDWSAPKMLTCEIRTADCRSPHTQAQSSKKIRMPNATNARRRFLRRRAESRSLLFLSNNVLPNIGHENFWHLYCAVRLLVVFDNGNKNARRRNRC